MAFQWPPDWGKMQPAQCEGVIVVADDSNPEVSTAPTWPQRLLAFLVGTAAVVIGFIVMMRTAGPNTYVLGSAFVANIFLPFIMLLVAAVMALVRPLRRFTGGFLLGVGAGFLVNAGICSSPYLESVASVG